MLLFGIFSWGLHMQLPLKMILFKKWVETERGSEIAKMTKEDTRPITTVFNLTVFPQLGEICLGPYVSLDLKLQLTRGPGPPGDVRTFAMIPSLLKCYLYFCIFWPVF